MSEHAIIFVELDVSLDEAAGRARTITDWLIGEGFATRNPKRGPTQPSELITGPRAAEAVDVPSDAWTFLGLSNSGVDVAAERVIEHPVENYEPPPCPVCATPIDGAYHWSLMESWFLGDEPVATCGTCGETNRLGDWVSTHTFYAGNLAVRFHNWTPLSEKFTGDLGSRLGLRWRVVFRHT